MKSTYYKYMIFFISAWYVVSSLSYHPHYISYFNELIGDRKNMYKYLADSNVDWGDNDFYMYSYVNLHLEKNKDLYINVNPDQQEKGMIIVNINNLLGVNINGDLEKYRWLREKYEPIGHIAYSWLIFNVP